MYIVTLPSSHTLPRAFIPANDMQSKQRLPGHFLCAPFRYGLILWPRQFLPDPPPFLALTAVKCEASDVIYAGCE